MPVTLMRVFLTFSAAGFRPAPGNQAGTYSKAEATSTKKALSKAGSLAKLVHEGID